MTATLRRQTAPVAALWLAIAGLLLSATTVFGATSSDYLLQGEARRHADRWHQLKGALFADTDIVDSDTVIDVSAPVIPKDPAMVPVTIQSQLPESSTTFIKTISLLVDHNPAPLAAVFHFTGQSGAAHLKTRVRVNEFSNITVVAETSDGKFFRNTAFVKASGGCDTPPRIDAEKIKNTLGAMKLSLPGGAVRGQSSPADLSIVHPNYNGMQVSNTAGVYIPPKLVQKVAISFADKPLLTIDGHMSLSQDPRFRFYYLPNTAGKFNVQVIDSDQAEFEQSWSVDLVER